MEIRLILFILTSIVAGTMTALRWKYVWKKKSSISIGGVGFFLSFLLYSLFAIFGILPEEVREFVFALLFALSWGFVATGVAGKKINCYLITIGEILAFLAISVALFGMQGFLFGAILAFSFASNFNHVFKGLLPRFTLFAILVDLLIYSSIVHILLLILGRHPNAVIDSLSGALALLCAVTYFIIAKPAVITGKLQADSIRGAFKI